LFDHKRQEKLLKVEAVRQVDDDGRVFEITFAGSKPQKVTLANRPQVPSQKQIDALIQDRNNAVGDEAKRQISEKIGQLTAELAPVLRKEREEAVAKRASELPDWSVEMIYLSQQREEGGKSRFFTVRTTEMEPDLVQVSVDRLLRADS